MSGLEVLTQVDTSVFIRLNLCGEFNHSDRKCV